MCFTPMELDPHCSAELRFTWSKYTCPYLVEAPCDFQLLCIAFYAVNSFSRIIEAVRSPAHFFPEKS